MQAFLTGAGGVQEAATVPILVAGADLDNVRVVTSAGWSMNGQVITDAGGAPTFAGDRISISGQTLIGSRDARQRTGQVNEDWTFSITGIFGAARVRVTVPDGWMMKAVLHDGRDISDMLVEAKTGEQMSSVQIILSNRVTTVAGQVVDDKGVPVADGTVLVFASQAEKWFENSRYVRATRPDEQGGYEIKGLPPGEYLAVAVDYVQEGMWNDPDFLESMRKSAQRLALSDGESRSISLRLISP